MPDQNAIAVAQTAAAVIVPETMVLFGSRAAGGWRADSDIDLLAVAVPQPEQPAAACAAIAAAAAQAKACYGRYVGIDLMLYRPEDYARYARDPSHFTAGIQANGAVVPAAAPPPAPETDPRSEPAVVATIDFAHRQHTYYLIPLTADADGPAAAVLRIDHRRADDVVDLYKTMDICAKREDARRKLETAGAGDRIAAAAGSWLNAAPGPRGE